MSELFPGFASRRVATSGAEIHCEFGGSGPPLLLLHGYPQTHAMWHRIAPRRASPSAAPSCAPTFADTGIRRNPKAGPATSTTRNVRWHWTRSS